MEQLQAKQEAEKLKKELHVALITHAHSIVDFDAHYNHMRCVYDWSKKYDFTLLGYKGLMAADARELACRTAIEQGCTHALFLDADHIIPTELFEYLIENADEAMVSGLVARRYYPFDQVAYGKLDKSKSFVEITIPMDGTVYEVGACAFGCTLINLEKLQELEKPWFRDTCEVGSDGTRHNIRSDINLSDMFRAKGYKVWIDTRLHIIHQGANFLVSPKNSPELKRLYYFYKSSFDLNPGQHGCKVELPRIM